MLKSNGESHQKWHGQKGADWTPEARAKGNREEYREGIDLQTLSHKRRRYELAFNGDKGDIEEGSNGRFLEGWVEEQPHHAERRDDDSRSDVGDVIEHSG